MIRVSRLAVRQTAVRGNSCHTKTKKKKKTSPLHYSAVTSSVSNNLFSCTFSICPYKLLKGHKKILKNLKFAKTLLHLGGVLVH